MKNVKKIKYILYLSVPLLLWILAFGVFLVNDQMGGDAGDARNMMYIMEHWFRFFCGEERFLAYNMFYPVNNALVYSDMLLLVAVPYSILRFFTVNMYISYKYVTLGFSLLGLIGMFHLTYKKMKCNGCVAVFATIVFSMANIYVLFINNWIMAAMVMFPFMGIIMINLFTNFEDKKKRIVYGVLLITILASIFYTSCYIAYYILLVAMFSIIVFLVYDIFVSKEILTLIFSWIKNNFKETIFYVIYGIILMFPFLNFYLINGVGNKRDWSDVSMYFQNLISYIQMPDYNLFMGGLFGHNGRGISGIPILTIVALIGVVCLSVNMLIRNKKNYLYLLSLDFALISLIIPFFAIEINGFSLWYYIYRFFPGAASMRGTFRFLLLIPFFSALAIACIFKNDNINKKLEVIIVILLSCQYLTFAGIASGWSSTEQTIWLESIPEPPDECRVMCLLDTSEKYGNSFTISQLDSLAIANKFNLKCINGYCSYYPDGWLRINYMMHPGYLINVFTWLQRNNAFDEQSVYVYNEDIGSWVHLSGFPSVELIGKYTPIRNGYLEEGSIYIENEGLIFGPYVNLNNGTYMIKIFSDDVEKLNFGVSHEEVGCTWSVKGINDNEAEVIVSIPVDIDNFEFLIYNWSGNVVKIDSVVLCEP